MSRSVKSKLETPAIQGDRHRLPDVLFAHPSNRIALFQSLDSMGDYAKAYAKQWREEHAAGGR